MYSMFLEAVKMALLGHDATDKSLHYFEVWELVVDSDLPIYIF